ncbi:hypothetical protein WJX84_010166 [Apatococcus fuscideae]|uniref:Small ribosomal subunit protein bS18c n=1 Tax=Apatococcus fuscideae TaxID=2026836 RepID=A0AAW1T5D2_9CHLO
MSGLRLLGRSLSKQAEHCLKTTGVRSQSCILQSSRGFASKDGDAEAGPAQTAGTGAAQKTRKNWRALADEQLRTPVSEQAQQVDSAAAQGQASETEASSQQQTWSAVQHQNAPPAGATEFPAASGSGMGPGHDDPFMQEEKRSRQSEASAPAPSTDVSMPDAGNDGGLRASEGGESGTRASSYTDDPFMRSERESRGLGNTLDGSSQRAPETPKKPGGPQGTSKFPRKTVGGQLRDVDYDDPFMRSERASRLVPGRPGGPEAVEEPLPEEPPRGPSTDTPAASQQQASSQAGLLQQSMEDTQQDLRVGPRKAGAQASKLQNQVHQAESARGQLGAASGKTPEEVNVPRLEKKATKAQRKAKQAQEKAQEESEQIGERIGQVEAAPVGPIQATGQQDAAAGVQSSQELDDADLAASNALQAAADAEAAADREALEMAAAASEQQQQPQPQRQPSQPSLSPSQKVHRKAMTEMIGTGQGPDPMTGFAELGRREGGQDAAPVHPLDASGRPLAIQSMTFDQRQALMRASPRIHPRLLYMPGMTYSPQDLVEVEGGSSSMFEVPRQNQRSQDVRVTPIPGPEAARAADFRNTALLDAYLSESGKLHPRRRTHLSAKDQRSLVRKVKLARQLALLPTTSNLASLNADRPSA